METPKNVGRYEVLEELGRGAMGTVYRAKDPAMDRVVALKTVIAVALASEQGSEFRERFYREARAAGRLAHPGIVAVFDVGEDAGLPFLVMEFVNGQTLADAVKQGERLTLERVCEIGQQLAEALGYAHQQGVIHRDIKPANILLTSREAYGVERPKITDFGVAKLAAGQITTTGQMLGTPAFMPPEQFTGAPIDGRADIFSLGVILYWMATGEQPFPGETMTAVSYKVVHTEPVPPRKLNPSIPAALDGLILKCLAKSPADRYQSGEELAQELAGLRTASRTDLQRTAFSMPPIDSQATIDVRTPNTIPIVPANLTQSTAISSPVGTVPAAKKTDYRLILGAVAAVLVLSVGWLLLRNKNQSSHTATQLPIASPVVAANPPVPTPAPVAEKISHAVPSPASAPTKVEKKVAPVPVAPVSPKATPPAPKLAAVEFDPTTLNPKENSKLKIDANHMPATLDFTVEMNGKIYFHRSADGNKAEYEGLFVPPGVQEFRVTASSGKVTKSSNIVSTEFKAKKKKTLKIELRPETKTAGNNETDLSPDTQIFVTLK